MGSRKGAAVLLRLDPRVAETLDAMAADDRRTRTAQVEWLVEREQERREREESAGRVARR